MAEHRWEWTLPGGARVAATLDPDAGTEAVLLDGRVVSRAARATLPGGHTFPMPGTSPDEADTVVVSFDPRLVICVLRVGREEVSPTLWPEPGRAKPRPPPRTPVSIRPLAIVLVLVAALGGAAYLFAKRQPTGEARGAMTGVHRADNGLFVAHFPPSFTARAAAAGGKGGVVLEDRARSEAIVILAMTIGEGAADPWELQSRIHGEALANLPRGGGAHEETSRTDGTCLGQPAAIVLGRVTATNGARAALWSCAFRRGPAGYLVMYAVPENEQAGAARLASIVDATELTRLDEISGSHP